jgi:hypothetical protein
MKLGELISLSGRVGQRDKRETSLKWSWGVRGGVRRWENCGCLEKYLQILFFYKYMLHTKKKISTYFFQDPMCQIWTTKVCPVVALTLLGIRSFYFGYNYQFCPFWYLIRQFFLSHFIEIHFKEFFLQEPKSGQINSWGLLGPKKSKK